MGILRVFKSLLAEFVSGEMVALAVGGGGGSMGMRRKVVKFRSSIVCALGHRVLLPLFDAIRTTMAIANTSRPRSNGVAARTMAQ
jgi:hypothetical protein